MLYNKGMKKEQKEKLKIYLEGFLRLLSSATPIGAVVFQEKDKKEVVELVKKSHIPCVALRGEHADVLLPKIISVFSQGKGIAIFLEGKMDAKLKNQFFNISENTLYVQLAGEKKPKILNPIPPGARVLFLAIKKEFEKFGMSQIVTSVCRL